MKKDFEINQHGKAVKRPGTKFVCAALDDEIVLFAQDGCLVTNERIIDISEERKHENRTLQ